MEKKREGKNAFVVQPPVLTKFWTESWLGNCIVSEQITDFLIVVFEAMLFRLVFERTLISSIQESSFLGFLTRHLIGIECELIVLYQEVIVMYAS